MIRKNRLKNRLKKAMFGLFFVFLGILGSSSGVIVNNTDVYAVEEPEVVTIDDNENEETTGEETREMEVEQTNETNGTTTLSTISQDDCKNSLGSMWWLVCPATGKISEAVDWLYEKIEGVLVINPIEMEDGTPIYEIWKYFRGITNIIFSIFLLVVIYSQLTGLGISNYGIKKVLPKLIIAAVLVNLSFLICTLAVDISNIVGDGLRGVFDGIQQSTMSNIGSGADMTTEMKVSYAQMYSSLSGGAALAVGGGVIAFETGAIWMLIPVVLGALVSVVTGLITIALRQAVVALLIMISPLAVVAYVLPNTEKWFKKWSDLLKRMLIFYPMFSLLFGASSLAGFAIIASAKDGFGILLGSAIQIFPLFFSWSLMKMSGTFLETINTKMRGLAAKPVVSSRAWADSKRQLSKARHLASGNVYTPSLRLMQYLSDRKVAREAELSEKSNEIKARGLAYHSNSHYRRDGSISRKGESAYASQARVMGYERDVERDKNNLSKGYGDVARAARDEAQKARLSVLDKANTDAADYLKVERARGEKIDYENAVGFHNRMEDAINAHFDSQHIGEVTYERHNIKKRDEAEARYATVSDIMGGDVLNVQYAAASAAQAYDTQSKIIMTKMQKYFELTPPTRDVRYRLQEFSKYAKMAENGIDFDVKAADNIDALISGMRILNQRGDTDFVKEILDDIIDKKYGGLELGTHASQSIASFLMFDVKDNDPFLRRFGKYINLETAKVFDENKRQEVMVTYDEYIKGYHKEPDGSVMYAKKPMAVLVEGTSLDNVERTAFKNLDESLMKAYEYADENGEKHIDVEGYLKKRDEIQKSIGPQFISASLKYLSGSEQLKSAVSFLTGYSSAQVKNDDGSIKLDKDGNVMYEWGARWSRNGDLADNPGKAEKYFRNKSLKYFEDQTPMQLLGLRSDYKEPLLDHLMNAYLDEKLDENEEFQSRKAEIQTRYADLPADEAQKKRSDDIDNLRREMVGEEYQRRVSEIQTRYADLPADEAQKKRKNDVAKLRMEMAREKVMGILGNSGKLEQIYRTRRSGAANNAKDWARELFYLDNEPALYNEVTHYRKKRQKEWKEEMRQRRESDPSIEDVPSTRIYNGEDKQKFENEMSNINDDYGDEDKETFFKITRDKLNEWFPNDFEVWSYEKFYENNPYATNDDLYKWIKDFLDDLNRYPGNRDSME